MEKIAHCYLCDKTAELMCLKCNQDVCKSHYRMGMCSKCYEKRLKTIQRVITAIIILALIGIT